MVHEDFCPRQNCFWPSRSNKISSQVEPHHCFPQVHMTLKWNAKLDGSLWTSKLSNRRKMKQWNTWCYRACNELELTLCYNSARVLLYAWKIVTGVYKNSVSWNNGFFDFKNIQKYSSSWAFSSFEISWCILTKNTSCLILENSLQRVCDWQIQKSSTPALCL